MKDSFLDVGQIVRTHGIRGEVKLIPWADSAEFLLGFKKFHIDGAPVAVKHAYVHNGAGGRQAYTGMYGLRLTQQPAGRKDRIQVRQEQALRTGVVTAEQLAGVVPA